MPEIIQVTYRKLMEVAYFNPEGLDLNIGDKCLIETENGLELGEISEAVRIVDSLPAQVKKIVRKLNQEDKERLDYNQKKEQEALKICIEKIQDRELVMKLVGVEYTFNRSKLFIYYTAPDRVDFRELVKDLAYIFKTRIEMCQVGVRDEAKMFGGFGPCGLRLCCVTFLKDFKPVTIEMAKEQELSLASSKISGVCGRLMCCLSYECHFYQEARRHLPKIDSKVHTKDGPGKVKSINVLKNKITVELEEGTVREYPVQDISSGFLDKIKQLK